jgi:hypothetical protein
MKNILFILLVVICFNLSGQYNDLTKDHITANYFIKSKKTMEADSIYLRGFGYVSGYILKKLAHDTMYAHLLAYDHHDSLIIDGSGLKKIGVQKLGIDTNKILTKWDTLLIHNQLQSWFNSLAKTIDANDTTYWGKSLKPSDTTGFKVQTKTAFKNDTVNNSKTGTVTPWRWNYWNNKGGESTTLTVSATNTTGNLSSTIAIVTLSATSNKSGTSFEWFYEGSIFAVDSVTIATDSGLYTIVATNNGQIATNYVYVIQLNLNADYGNDFSQLIEDSLTNFHQTIKTTKNIQADTIFAFLSGGGSSPIINQMMDSIHIHTTGLLNNRGNYNASGNVFTTTGGSGIGGAIMNGDWFTISVKGFVYPDSLRVGYIIVAKNDNPGQTNNNWNIITTGIPSIPTGRIAGDGGIGYINYNGRTAKSGQFSSGNGISGTDTLNYSGTIHSLNNLKPAIWGTSNSSYGVYGNSGSGIGVYGNSSSNYGLASYSNSSYGIYAYSNSSIGLYAYSGSSTGAIITTSTGEKIAIFSKSGTNSGDKSFIDTLGNFSKCYTISTMYTDTSSVTNVETPLWRKTIKAHTLDFDNDIIIANYTFLGGASSTTNNVYVNFAGSQIAAFANYAITGVYTNAIVTIIRSSSTTARCFSTVINSNLSPSTQVIDITSKNWTIANMLELTGDGILTGDIVCKGGTIKFNK